MPIPAQLSPCVPLFASNHQFELVFIEAVDGGVLRVGGCRREVGRLVVGHVSCCASEAEAEAERPRAEDEKEAGRGIQSIDHCV